MRSGQREARRRAELDPLRALHPLVGEQRLRRPDEVEVEGRRHTRAVDRVLGDPDRAGLCDRARRREAARALGAVEPVGLGRVAAQLHGAAREPARIGRGRALGEDHPRGDEGVERKLLDRRHVAAVEGEHLALGRRRDRDRVHDAALDLLALGQRQRVVDELDARLSGRRLHLAACLDDVQPALVALHATVGEIGAEDDPVAVARVAMRRPEQHVHVAGVGRAGERVGVGDRGLEIREGEGAVMVAVRPALLAEDLLGGGERDRVGARLGSRGEDDSRSDGRVELVAASDATGAAGHARGRDLDFAADPHPIARLDPLQLLGPKRHHHPLLEAGVGRDRNASDQLRVVAGGRQLGLWRLLRAACPRARRRDQQRQQRKRCRRAAAAAGRDRHRRMTTRPSRRSSGRGACLNGDMQRRDTARLDRLGCQAPRARAHRCRARADRRQARTRAQRRRAGDVQPAVVRALRLQALPEAAPAPADGGPAGADGTGRERRRGLDRRRVGGRVQGRVAQPSERGRAVPGRRDRGRRDPARRLRARGAADRGTRLAALRRARFRALALPVRPRGRGHRALRELDRRADRRRRGLLRGPLRAELPRQRDVRRARAPQTGWCAPPRPGRATRSS